MDFQCYRVAEEELLPQVTDRVSTQYVVQFLETVTNFYKNLQDTSGRRAAKLCGASMLTWKLNKATTTAFLQFRNEQTDSSRIFQEDAQGIENNLDRSDIGCYQHILYVLDYMTTRQANPPAFLQMGEVLEFQHFCTHQLVMSPITDHLPQRHAE